jgi:hypothetical protein
MFVADWTGGQQPGFRFLKYVLKQFYRKKSGPRTPRPPFLGMLAWSAEWLPSTRNWSFRWPLPLTSPPQVIPKAMVFFGRRVAPALWRLAFAALISWVVLNVGGSGLAVGVFPTYTCRACDLAPVVLPRPEAAFLLLFPKVSTGHAVEDTAPRR